MNLISIREVPQKITNLIKDGWELMEINYSEAPSTTSESLIDSVTKYYLSYKGMYEIVFKAANKDTQPRVTKSMSDIDYE